MLIVLNQNFFQALILIIIIIIVILRIGTLLLTIIARYTRYIERMASNMAHNSSPSAHSAQAAEISHLIRNRRTIRSFTTAELPEGKIAELLTAAARPSFIESEQLPCRFLVVATPAGKQKAAEIIMGTYAEQKFYKWVLGKINQMMMERIVKIPALLFVITRQEGNAQVDERNFSDVCAMLHTFSLLAWEENIGLVWGTSDMLHKSSFIDGLGLQANERVHCLMYLGHYEKLPKIKPRTSAAKKFTSLS